MPAQCHGIPLPAGSIGRWGIIALRQGCLPRLSSPGYASSLLCAPSPPMFETKPRVHRFQNHRDLRVELAPASGLELLVDRREAPMTQRGVNLPADCPFQDDLDNFLRHVPLPHNARMHFRAVMGHCQIVGNIAMTGASGIMTPVPIATVTMTIHAMPERTNNTCWVASRVRAGKPLATNCGASRMANDRTNAPGARSCSGRPRATLANLWLPSRITTTHSSTCH